MLQQVFVTKVPLYVMVAPVVVNFGGGAADVEENVAFGAWLRSFADLYPHVRVERQAMSRACATDK